MDYRLLLYICIMRIHHVEGCIFGNVSECALPCRCENNVEQCDTVTGSCVSGCKQWQPFPRSGTRRYDWNGPGCTIGNIALGKSAEQSGIYYPQSTAEKAVDGILQQQEYDQNPSNLINCIHTDVKYPGNAWWRVDLGDLHAVLNFTIFNRFESGERTGYFRVGVGNSSINNQHSLCVRFDGEIPDSGSRAFFCPHPLLGRYVSLVRYGGREPNVLNFCEIVIIGYRVIAADCSRCDSACDNIVGCQDCKFWQPPHCNTACKPGTYGVSCRSSCYSRHCRDGYTTCEPVNGSCPNGCDAWSSGTVCDTHINEAYLNSSSARISVINDHSVEIFWQPATGIKPDLERHYGYIVQRTNDAGFQDVLWMPHQAGITNYSAVVDQLRGNTEYTFRLGLFRHHGGLTEVFPQYIGGINVTTACGGFANIVNLHISANGPPYYVFVSWKRQCDNIKVTTLYYRQVGTRDWMAKDVSNPLTASLEGLPIKNLGTYEVKVKSLNNAGQNDESSSLLVKPPNSADDTFLEPTIALSVLCAACLVTLSAFVVNCLRQKKAHNAEQKQNSHSMSPVGTSDGTGQYCTPSTVSSALNIGAQYDVICGQKTGEEESYYEVL